MVPGGTVYITVLKGPIHCILSQCLTICCVICMVFHPPHTTAYSAIWDKYSLVSVTFSTDQIKLYCLSWWKLVCNWNFFLSFSALVGFVFLIHEIHTISFLSRSFPILINRVAPCRTGTGSNYIQKIYHNIFFCLSRQLHEIYIIFFLSGPFSSPIIWVPL